MLLAQLCFATREVVAPRVRVLFDDPDLQAYAERVAREAEGALDALVPLFGFTPPPITLRLEDTSDLYNALASPLPRPNVGLRALFPTEVALSYRAGSDLRLLLVHELTHVMQSVYLEGRGGGLRLGLVGENVANVPPAWLVEGLAVWTESEYTTGGRRGDALTRGLLESAALAGTWPTLAEASLPTYGAWPGAQTEYLFGVGFTDFLIRKHGFEAVKKSLAQHNAAGFLRPFAASWRLAVGTDLWREWRAWGRVVRRRAEARAQNVREVQRAGVKKTDSGWYTRAPALSPDGTQLAWVGWPAAIMLAEVGGEELKDVRTLLDDRLPSTLEWLDAHTLLYARAVPRPEHTYSELFTLDVRTGRETRLTDGARAKLPAPLPGGCVLYVTDDGEGSGLEQTCPDRRALRRWRTPAGAHIVGLATSPQGRVALSVWRRGRVDLALLAGDTLRYLTQDRAQDLEPTWHGEDALLFRSDRDPRGVFELYSLELGTPDRLSRLTRTLGGALMPEAGARGVWFVRLGGRGYDLAWLPEAAPVVLYQTVQQPEKTLPAKASAVPAPFTVRPYNPLSSLRPYGWLPTGGGVSLFPLGAALELSLVAQDDSADHSVRTTLGFDSGRVALAGFYGFARYDYGTGLALRATPSPLRFSLQAGAWPHVPHLSEARETAAGVQVGVAARLPQDDLLVTLGLEAGLVRLLGQSPDWLLDARAEGALSTRRTDPWGYHVEGWRGSITGLWSATGGAPSLGAWLGGAYVLPVEGIGRLEFGVRAGYRPAWPLPLKPGSDLAALVSVGLARSFPVELRYGDGLYALERVTLEPRLRSWLGGALYLGGDLTVSLDSVLGYGAPVSVGGTLGYAGSFWYRLGVRLPL
jgi:hypothetical protein